MTELTQLERMVHTVLGYDRPTDWRVVYRKVDDAFAIGAEKSWNGTDVIFALHMLEAMGRVVRIPLQGYVRVPPKPGEAS